MQIELLRELMKLQKDMIIMLLSMLEGKIFSHLFIIFSSFLSLLGNVLNGPSKSLFCSKFNYFIHL